MSVSQRHVHVRGDEAFRDAPRDERSAFAIREREADGEVAWSRVAEADIDADAGQIGFWCEVHGFERVAATCLEIHGLPHAARLSVALLALELERVRRVVDADDEALLAARVQMRRELEREWRVATLVGAERRSVEPYRGSPVRRAEDDEHTLALPRVRHADRASIPPDVRTVRDA